MSEQSAADHEVTFLSGGRVGGSWTAQCSCGKRFESTHNYRLRASITRHKNKMAADSSKVADSDDRAS